MTSREQIYKAALEEIAREVCRTAMAKRQQAKARAALEAAAKVGDDDKAERLAHAFVLPSMCPSELCSFDEQGQCTGWRFHEHAIKQRDAYLRGAPGQPCTGAEFLEAMAGVEVDPPICRDCGLFETVCICHEELNGPGGAR